MIALRVGHKALGIGHYIKDVGHRAYGTHHWIYNTVNGALSRGDWAWSTAYRAWYLGRQTLSLCLGPLI